MGSDSEDEAYDENEEDRTTTTTVREVFIVHVGGTRCVTFSTDNNMKIHGRITLTVECIQTCILIFLFYV
jgi:hypothetical protein